MNNVMIFLKKKTNNYMRFHSNGYTRICNFYGQENIWMNVNQG